MGIDEIIRLANLIKKKPGINKAILASYFNKEAAEGVEKLLLQQAYTEGVDIAQLNPFLPEPEDIDNGSLKIGKLEHSKRDFGIPEEGHMLICGQTGMGKTTTIKNLLKECILNGIHFIDFDSRKDHYSLAEEFPEVNIIKVIEDFRINPLKPPSPSVPEKVWQSRVCMIMSSAFGFFIGSKDYLIKTLSELNELKKPAKASPNLIDLKNFLKKKEKMAENRFGPNREYSTRNLNRLEAILTTNRKIFDVETGFDIDKLSRSYLILDMDGLDADLQRFLINLIIYSIIYHRMYTNQRGQNADPVRIVVDEARRYFPREASSRHIDFADIGFLVSQTREFGIFLVIAEQIPHMLSVECIAESRYKIILNISSGTDLRLIREACNLNQAHIDLITSLPVGTAAVKISDCPYPFLIELNPYTGPTCSDPNKTAEKSRDFINYLMEDVVKADNKVLEICLKNAKAEIDRELEEQEKDFLKHIARKPLLPMTRRYEEFGISRSKGDKLVDRMEKKGLVKRVSIITGMRGGNPKLIDITSRGAELLRELGLKTSHLNRGIEHFYWQNQIKDFFSQEENISAEIEGVIGDTRVDVLLQINGKLVAVEVAMSPEYELENIKRDLSSGCSFVLVVLKSWIGIGSIKREIERLGLNRKVDFILARDIMRRKEWILNKLRKI